MTHKKRRKRPNKYKYKTERRERLERLFLLLESQEIDEDQKPNHNDKNKDDIKCQDNIQGHEGKPKVT